MTREQDIEQHLNDRLQHAKDMEQKRVDEIEKSNKKTMKTPKFFEFETIDELLKDKFFLTSLHAQITQMRIEIESRPELAPEKRYKSNWASRMMNENRLTADFFLENIGAIWANSSKLSREQREIIKVVCLNAHNTAITQHNQKFIEALNKPKKEFKPKKSKSNVA